MIETINGLLSVKPGNEPQQGETRTFVIEQRPARNGKKAWTKIRGAGENYGGAPYRILSVEPTGFTDTHGNISFNIEIEKSVNGGDEPCTEKGLIQESTSRKEPQSIPASSAAPTSEPESAAGINEARQRIMQDANLMLIAMEGARYVAGQWRELHDCELPNEHFQALCASLFIEASSRRTTDGVNWWSFVDRMPTKPLPVHNGNKKVERQTGDQEESLVPPDDRYDTAYGKPPF